MLYRKVATSSHPVFRLARKIVRAIRNFSMPAPRIVFRPLLLLFLLLRTLYFFVVRVFFCEPLFKAYCTKYGRNLHTGVFLHWVQGQGDLIVGDNVLIDGKSSFFFGARYAERPTLIIGNNTFIGHGSAITVGDRIEIGSNCYISGGASILDTPGHPIDPVERRAGKPAPREDVRPVTIGDDVWIGQRVIIMPGVTIGRGSVVAAAAVVTKSVPPNTLVAGVPAKPIRTIVETAVAVNSTTE